MDNEQPHQELVKCVVVGDTAVGKTRLVWARASNKQFCLGELLNTHVPTVWAIDQYRVCKEVLERSWVVVDGVNVSLRLWDTFGDHDKDRRYSYGRSDVVLLCFSVSNPNSLRNCRVMWYPEIRRFCPNTPILLVGCKNDLRHICKEEEYKRYCRERSPLIRATRESDLVMPAEGRAVAREMGVDYYETSVLSYYGVSEVFDNVIRAALSARRHQRFWITNLKRVQRPLVQAPFRPPKPTPSPLEVSVTSLPEDLHCLYRCQALTDLVLIADSTVVHTHKFLLSAASTAIHKLLLTDLSDCVSSTRRSSDSSMVSSTFGDATMGNFNSDTECLIEQPKQNMVGSCVSNCRLRDVLKRRSSVHNLLQPFSCSEARPGVHKTLNHPAFASISIEQWDDRVENNHQCEDHSLSSSTTTSTGLDSRNLLLVPVQTVITFTKQISGQALRQLVHFMYAGSIYCHDCRLPFTEIGDLKQAAEYLELPEVVMYTSRVMEQILLYRDVQILTGRLREVCLDGGYFSDVLFQLEDGTACAHRPLLMARCDMMHAMFSGDFLESSAKVVNFPGVKQRTFRIFLQFLYTDSIPTLKVRECEPTIELANRLCLPRLVSLVEVEVIDLLMRIQQAGGDVSEDCLHLLEPMQLHNASQLVEWCLITLATSYNNVCQKHPKLVRNLHPENQAWLNRHRWPPVWYLKEFDYYERCVMDRQREANPIKPLKRSRNTAGCLCFTSKARKGSGTSKQSYRTM